MAGDGLATSIIGFAVGAVSRLGAALSILAQRKELACCFY